MSSKIKPKFKGPRVRQSGNAKQVRVRKPFTDKARMNSGGFYRGMPGVTLVEYTIKGVKQDYRKMIQFLVSEDGYSTAILYAHNTHIKMAIEQAILHDPMLKGVVYSAVIDHMFRNKTIWNWPIRSRYRFLLWWNGRKQAKALNKSLTNGTNPEEHVKEVLNEAASKAKDIAAEKPKEEASTKTPAETSEQTGSNPGGKVIDINSKKG